MGASIAAVGEFFASFGAESAVAAAGSEVAGSSALAIGAGAAETAGSAALSLGSAALADGTIAAGAGGGLLSGSLGKTALTAAAASIGSGVVTSLLAPKPPKLSAVTAMPDPLAQEQARRQSLIEQTARRGRASTIMTDPGNSSGKLGG